VQTLFFTTPTFDNKKYVRKEKTLLPPPKRSGFPRLNNSMKIAIVEDRPEDQVCLAALLAENVRGRSWTYTVETYASGEAFWRAANKVEAESFDIVFLDVMMDGIDGLETERRFRAKDGSALIVIVTVGADFAIDGYEINAAAFLIKPIDTEMFRRTLDRLERKLRAREHRNDPHWCFSLPTRAFPPGRYYTPPSKITILKCTLLEKCSPPI